METEDREREDARKQDSEKGREKVLQFFSTVNRKIPNLEEHMVFFPF